MPKRGIFKQIVCMLMTLFILLQIDPANAAASEYWPEGPETQAPSIIVTELSTGTVLYDKNSQEVHFPASITKIMTALLVIEHTDLNEMVTFSDASIDETKGSSIARDYGEQMTVEQCLYGLMLASANECAYALAEHVAGTMPKFVEMMNQKAEELGCKNTNFTNPHGLHDENHYTSAYDMALIARAAYKNETFRIITGTERYTIPPTNKHEEQTDLQNHNEMLYPFKSTKYVYENCKGGKTGHTDAANSTLVTFAEKDGMSLVCVVMNAQSPCQWTDSKNLFEYCFDNFQLLNISDHETKYDTSENAEGDSLNNSKAFVDIDEKACVVLPKMAEFSDASSEINYDNVSSDIVGTIAYTYAGHTVGSADIKKTGVQVENAVFQRKDPVASSEEAGTVSTIKIKPVMIAAGAGAVMVLLALILIVKKVADNFYIIRHNVEVRRNRKDQYRRGKKKRRRRRTRR